MNTRIQVVGQERTFGIEEVGTITMQNIALRYGWKSAKIEIPESSLWPEEVLTQLLYVTQLPPLHLSRFSVRIEDGSKFAYAIDAAMEDMKAGKLDEEIFRLFDTDGWDEKLVNNWRKRFVDLMDEFIQFCKLNTFVVLIISTTWTDEQKALLGMDQTFDGFNALKVLAKREVRTISSWIRAKILNESQRSGIVIATEDSKANSTGDEKQSNLDSEEDFVIND